MERDVTNFLRIFIIIFSLTMSAFSAKSQGSSQKLNMIIHVEKNKIRVDSLLAFFSRQTHYGFSYNSKKINSTTLISIKDKKQTLLSWFNFLERVTGIKYTLVGNHIILSDRSTSQKKNINGEQRKYNVKLNQKNKSFTKTTGHKFTSSKNISSNNTSINNLLKLHSAIPSLLVATIDINSLKSKIDLPNKNSEELIKNFDTSSFKNISSNTNLSDISLISKKNKKEKGKKITKTFHENSSSLFIKTGVALNESFYFISSLQVGFSSYYAQVSWHKNNTVSGFSYSGGKYFRINDNINLNVQLNRSNFSKHFSTDTNSSIDPSRSILTKYKLTNLGIYLEKILSHRFSVEFGPVINYATVNYYKNNLPFSFSPPEKKFEKPYYLIKPPYFLVNSYTSGSVSNVKVWIGLQACIYFTFLK